jgi:hypothetical protein
LNSFWREKVGEIARYVPKYTYAAALTFAECKQFLRNSFSSRWQWIFLGVYLYSVTLDSGFPVHYRSSFGRNLI